ncbi:MAG TPA: hypothetical protein VGL91_13295 [Acidobacteriota bacterium]
MTKDKIAFSGLSITVLICLLMLSQLALLWAWSIIPTQNPSAGGEQFNSIAALSANDAWVVGESAGNTGGLTLIEHWNGTGWNTVSSPNPGASTLCGSGNVLNKVTATSPGDVWAVGYYYSCSLFKTLIEHWDGTSWSVVSSPSPSISGLSELRGVAASSADDVWAVGYYEALNGASLPLVEHWNGASWMILRAASPSASANVLNGVTVISANDAWAVGTYYDSQKGIFKTLIEHWDGTNWVLASSPSPGVYTFNILTGVAAVSATDVWAVGYYQATNASFLPIIEHWDGKRWRIVSTPVLSAAYGSANVLKDIAVVSASDIWAVGMFQNEATDYHQHRPLIEHWDGTNWSIISSPSPGKSAELNGVAALSSGIVSAAGLYSDYPIDIYYGTYTSPKTLDLQK